MAIFEGNHWTEDGYEFHVKGKTGIMKWLFTGEGIRALTALTVKDAWLRDDGEGIPVNLPFLSSMQAAFVKENKHVLKRLPLLERKVVETASKWLVVLFRNDSMYRTRIGWMICWLIEHGDPAHPEHTLKHLRTDYFAVERREDRIAQITALFDKVQEMVSTRQDTYGRFVTWGIRYIQEHKAEFQTGPLTDARGEYNADNWYGGKNGIGSAWNAVHGGRG